MAEVIGDTESEIIPEGERRYYPDGLQVSGDLQVSGTAVVGAPPPSFVGDSRANGTKRLYARADGTKRLYARAEGVID